MNLPTTLALIAPADGSAGGMGWFLPVQLILMGAVFYFLVIRPQSQARKRHQELLAGLKKNDEVMTAGGIIGRVKDIKEVKDSPEVRVTIESGTCTVVVDRSRIVRVGGSAVAEAGR